jgi:hypothetical protein
MPGWHASTGSAPCRGQESVDRGQGSGRQASFSIGRLGRLALLAGNLQTRSIHPLSHCHTAYYLPIRCNVRSHLSALLFWHRPAFLLGHLAALLLGDVGAVLLRHVVAVLVPDHGAVLGWHVLTLLPRHLGRNIVDNIYPSIGGQWDKGLLLQFLPDLAGHNTTLLGGNVAALLPRAGGALLPAQNRYRHMSTTVG